jgi:rod shape determining protein RodA
MLQNNNEISEKGRIDWFTVILYLVFIAFGWLNIYAANFDLESRGDELFELTGNAKRQLIWIGTALIVAFIITKIDVAFFETYAFVFFLIGIVVLILTIFLPPLDVRGSRSFLDIGLMRVQPAEFMKFVIALALAKVLSIYNFDLMKPKNLLLVSAIILVPFIIVLLQNEMGQALVYLALILVLYREGLPGGVLFMGVAAIVYFIFGIKFSDVSLGMFSKGELIVMSLIIVFTAGLVWSYVKRFKVGLFILFIAGSLFLGAFALSQLSVNIDWGLTALIALSSVSLYLLYLFFRYRLRTYLYIFFFAAGSFLFHESTEYVFNNVLEPHQSIRVKMLLGMEDDPLGAGFQVRQSKIAIGSGGLWGKGFLEGTQTKLGYIPDQDTDFIFCTIGEEHGFVGTTLVMVFFMIFMLRLLHIAERQTSVFGRAFGYGVISIFLFHWMVNVGMVIGIMPVIGIPLPFFSYGGSSLWGFTMMLFVLLRIDKMRKRRLDS